MGFLKIFWLNGKKAKRDRQPYIHTYIHTNRLPQVVLSAALQQKREDFQVSLLFFSSIEEIFSSSQKEGLQEKIRKIHTPGKCLEMIWSFCTQPLPPVVANTSIIRMFYSYVFRFIYCLFCRCGINVFLYKS